MRRGPDDASSLADGHLSALVRGLLVLRHFSVAELSAYSGVEPQAVQRFLAGSDELVDRLAGPTSDRWQVRREVIARLRASASVAAPVAGREAVMPTPPGDTPRPAARGDRPDVDDPDGDTEDWFALALRLVDDIEEERAASVAEASSATREGPEHGLPDQPKMASRTRGLGAASMYLARCESTFWTRQHWHGQRQVAELARVRDLRRRIIAMNGDTAPSPADDVQPDVLRALQEWSEPLPRVIGALDVRVPSVLQTLNESDLAHWVTGDLGISSPWYQAAARAIALREVERHRWPDVLACLVAHCVQVLSLSACGPALASIAALAATLEVGDLALPLLSAVLLSDTPTTTWRSMPQAVSREDRRIVHMALGRLSQAPTLPSRMRCDVSFACELLLFRSGFDADAELLAPGAFLRSMVDGLPWLERAQSLSNGASATFDRNLVRAMFLAAREPAARAALSAALVTPVGLALVDRLHEGGAARRVDSADSHLLIPCEGVARSLVDYRQSGDFDGVVLSLLLPVPQSSDESIEMCVKLSQEGWSKAARGQPLGAFGEGLKRRAIPQHLSEKFGLGEVLP